MVDKREGRSFRPHAVPHGALDKVQLNWNVRQWQELAARLLVLEARLRALEPPIVDGDDATI